MKARNVGEAILLRLKQLGTTHFFANPGTEFVSIIQAFRELPSDSVPRPILTPHEFQAVSMAYGCFLTSKRPQAVMTHANVGAANALIGLIGASRMNIPLIFISGMTAQSEHTVAGSRDKLIHWSQDSKDQGSLFREYVKWEAEIRDPSTAFDIVDRAYAMALSPPCGPVAIKVARDLLVREDVGSPPDTSSLTPLSAPAPSPQTMQQVSRWLESAERPLVITNRLGIDPTAVETLIRVSDRHAIGVVTPDDYYMSFPTTHSHHLGHKHGSALSDADCVIVLDTDAPWYPLSKGPSPASKVIHVGADPLFQTLPLRSHRGDLFVNADPHLFLDSIFTLEPANLRNRRHWLEKQRPREPHVPDLEAFNSDAVSRCLAEVLDEDTLLVNELGLNPQFLGCRVPGSYFRSGSASPLGWGMGFALSLAMMNPNKTVIAGIGDGVFYLTPVLANLLLSAQIQAPFITVILNNGGMASIAKTVTDFYPGPSTDLPLTSLSASEVSLEKCADLVTGSGLKACSANELRQALKDSIDFCREKKRPAVINALIE